MNNNNYKEEAISLITYDPETQKYVVHDEAIEFLNQVPGPIGIVGVAGMYRTGKSYLLNQMLLNRPTGFGIGASINPCTKGLWIWQKPLLGQTQDGETIYILVIDSEGIGALDEDSTHDSRVFALTVLLSSCFIYNSVGSIDESAIQNLSLVINLTKNIQIKSNQESDENVDFEDYAVHFPQFYWVVRDFSLQLVDNEGEQITQKEYLEKALGQQKGFSEQVEQKNRIRRCLTTFFKDRDCSTLVRPLTNEENLQNLDKIEFDKLRPEFFEQVIQLRKKILTRMKKKTIQGKSLTGEMYGNLILSYAEAINNGAVPNIENAWSYLCKNECEKAIVDGLESYDQVIKDVLHNKLPLSLEDLKYYHKVAKQASIDLFKKKAVGEIQDNYMTEILSKIKERFTLIKTENAKESERVCQNFIGQEYQAIERKLKMNEYQNYNEFQEDLTLFNNFFLENGPKTCGREKIIMEFVNKSQQDAINYLQKIQSHESELQKTLLEESKKKLQQEFSESKESSSKEIQSLRQKLQTVEQQKAELDVKEQVLLENLTIVKSEKDKLETEMKEQVQEEKKEYQKQITAYKMKQAVSDEKIKELERKIIIQQSEYDQEKALFNQKIAYYEKALEEYNKKEKDSSNDMKTLKKDQQTYIKEVQQKYETQIKSLEKQVQDLQESIQEMENQMQAKDNSLELEKKKNELNSANLNAQLVENNSLIENLQKQLQFYKENEAQNLSDQNDVTDVNKLQEKITALEDQIKQKDETLSNQKNSMEKEKALLKQKIEFLDQQNLESKKQLEENKRAHDAILKAFETTNALDNTKVMDNKSQQELKDQHTKEIKELESEFENAKQRLQQQIEALNEKNNELELKVKFEAADQEKEMTDIQDQLKKSQEDNQKLSDECKSLEEERNKQSAYFEERYIQKIKSLEDELEEQKSKSMKELKDLQQKSEQNLAQLKNIYEVERDTLERRINEEHDKYEKKLQMANEEYYEKMRTDQGSLEDEIENLKEELREQEANYNNVVNQYEHELALKQQTIETLEKYTKETKESLINLQNTHNSTLEQHMNNFATERKQLLEKIDLINQQLAKKEKDIFTLNQKKEYLESNAQKKEQSIEGLKQEYNAEKKQQEDKIEEFKQQLKEQGNQLLQQKIEFSKELALSNQKNEFLNKKNEELQKQQENMTLRTEEKLKLMKQEYHQEIAEKLEKQNQEKQQLETKYEKNKKALKEIEGTYNKQLSQLERDKAIIQEKLNNMELKKQELDQKQQAESNNLVQQITNIKEQQQVEKRAYITEIDKYKELNLQLEQDKNEIMTNYDRDKALWEGKFQFLEQQKEQAKHDLTDAMQKFELTLQHLQKVRINEKDENESNLNELLAQIEKKYQNQLQEQVENHERVVQDYENKIRRLNKEIKLEKEHNYAEKFGKAGQQMLSEKKLAEFIENEKKLVQEIESLKLERDAKILEHQAQVDQQADLFKQKMQDLEQKYKESETVRNNLIFEHEKEKAKWGFDREHLMAQKNDMNEQLDKVEKKKEQLLRENEKLKNEQRVQRRSINLAGNQTNNNLNSSNISNVNTNNTKRIQRATQSPLIPNQDPRALQQQQLDNSMNSKNQNLTDITNFSGIMVYDPNKMNHSQIPKGNTSNSKQELQSQYDKNVEKVIKLQ